jgi:hypothetical protein
MNINELYDQLETKKDFEPINLSNFKFDVQSDIDASRMEFCAFLVIDAIRNIAADQSYQNKLISHYKMRLKQTKNSYLLARYSHLLYILTHEKEQCEFAISKYKEIILVLSKKDSKAYVCYKVFNLAFQFISTQRNLINKELKPFLLDLIRAGNNDLKYWLIRVVEEHKKLYNAQECEFIPLLCKELALEAKEYTKCQSSAFMGLYFAKKNPNKFKLLIREFYEILGDNETKNIKKIDDQVTNIAIPHQNQHTYKSMMDYYKKGCCQEKYTEAVRLYNENKQHLQFIHIPIKQEIGPELSKMIEERYKQINELDTSSYLWYLIFGDSLMFLPNEKLMQLVKDSSNFYYKTMMRTVKIDLNGNAIPVDEKDEESWEKFRIMDMNLNFWIRIFCSSILNSIKDNKISYTKTRTFLVRHTYFGSDLNIKRSDVEIVYNWFEQIDYVFQHFFKQMKLFIQGKEPEWRLIIDTLPAKFEGILRDMIGIHGGSITKLNKNGRTEDLLLEDLLRDKSFLEIFNEDDKNLFEYVFTNKGLNIRNYVAHGFYKPKDYTIDKAILVFLCIMRLAKFRLNDYLRN